GPCASPGDAGGDPADRGGRDAPPRTTGSGGG
ncbi:rhodanese-like domain-containing protein, partial [Desulfovibrio oxamicus]|nr:rhodanese-like domain-containing protein [Nitratidesulfovibrio oxamicus]